MERFTGIIGIIVLLMIAFLLSNNRSKIDYKLVGWGLALQLGFALFILKTPIGLPFFEFFDMLIKKLLSFSDMGGDFLFASFISGKVEPPIINFAVRVLPTIIFFSALIAVLYHLGVMQFVVKGIAKVVQKTMGTSGSETLSVVGSIFVGQTEAPLLVRPYVKGMTKSEIMTIMVGGFATVAGGVMAIYVAMLKDIPGIAGHLMAASIMSAPAAIVIAKIMYPETEESQTKGTLTVNVEKTADNAMEALGDGATDGLKTSGKHWCNVDRFCCNDRNDRCHSRLCEHFIGGCFWICIPSSSLVHGCSLERSRNTWNIARRKNSTYRIDRLQRPGGHTSNRRIIRPYIDHRQLCALRICQFCFYRNPNGWYRWYCTEP